jgi:hypothetical protein
LLERAEPIDVMTVFAGRPDPPRSGPWDRFTGFPDSDAAMAARRSEELAAFEGTPHNVLALDLLQQQYLDGSRRAEDAERLDRALRDWLGEGGGGVAIPVGAGRRHRWPSARLESLMTARRGPPQHADHVWVRDVSLHVLAGLTQGRVLLYEELPYLLGAKTDRTVARVARSLGLAATPVELEVDRPAKATRVAHYESQVRHILTRRRRLDDADALPPIERYWWLTRG